MTNTIPNVPRELLELCAEILDHHTAYATSAEAKTAAELRSLLSAPSPAGVDGLDERMKAAGMFSAAELIAGAPIDAFMKHAGVNDMATYGQWLEMRRGECLRMQGRYDLGERDKTDDMYEWTISHSAVFGEAHVNFKAALAGNQAIIDGLRGEVAEERAKVAQLEEGVPRIMEATYQFRQQRDQLAGLLREAHDTYRAAIHWEYLRGTMKRIDAALAELPK